MIDRNVYCISPLEDLRWSKFIDSHPRASVFHTVGWLNTLRETYGFTPIAFTTEGPNDDLENVLVFCSVSSWLTGSRLISLPFSDHCEPLINSQDALVQLSRYIERMRVLEGRRYAEMRPMLIDLGNLNGFQKSSSFYLHRLDLRNSLKELFNGFHKDCVQRKIRRASREGLTYEKGRDSSLVDIFYALFKHTRLRHCAPPQPREWFQNLVENMGVHACIRIAFKAGQPAAAILTLSHGKNLVFKYCGSDARFHNSGGVHMLLWEIIQEAKQEGIEELDLGRSDCTNTGLVNFKERWSAVRTHLNYWRSPGINGNRFNAIGGTQYAKRAFERLPEAAIPLIGRFLYRHIG
jgi:hypothetical protein